MIIDIVFNSCHSAQTIMEATKNYWDVEESTSIPSSFITNSLLLTIYPATIHITSFDESETMIQRIVDYLSMLFKNMIIAISSSSIIEPFLNMEHVSVINITPTK